MCESLALAEIVRLASNVSPVAVDPFFFPSVSVLGISSDQRLCFVENLFNRLLDVEDRPNTLPLRWPTTPSPLSTPTSIASAVAAPDAMAYCTLLYCNHHVDTSEPRRLTL